MALLPAKCCLAHMYSTWIRDDMPQAFPSCTPGSLDATYSNERFSGKESPTAIAEMKKVMSEAGGRAHKRPHKYRTNEASSYVWPCLKNNGLLHVTGPGGLFATRVVTETGVVLQQTLPARSLLHSYHSPSKVTVKRPPSTLYMRPQQYHMYT